MTKINSFDECIVEFNKLLPTFDDKINFLKNCRDNSKFIENIKTNPKNEEELKNEILDENFRLAYVGVTRAKRKLYLSCAMEYKIFNKIREKAPNELFEILNNRTDDMPEEEYYAW